MPAGMRIAVLTSGGDAPGMNATLRTLVKVAVARQHEVLGVRDGYLGLMGGDFVPLGLREVDGITRFGGTILGSARALEMHTPEGRGQALRTIAERGIGGLVVPTCSPPRPTAASSASPPPSTTTSATPPPASASTPP
jgi:6-phosphofructokinase 1